MEKTKFIYYQHVYPIGKPLFFIYFVFSEYSLCIVQCCFKTLIVTFSRCCFLDFCYTIFASTQNRCVKACILFVWNSNTRHILPYTTASIFHKRSMVGLTTTNILLYTYTARARERLMHFIETQTGLSHNEFWMHWYTATTYDRNVTCYRMYDVVCVMSLLY